MNKPEALAPDSHQFPEPWRARYEKIMAATLRNADLSK